MKYIIEEIDKNKHEAYTKQEVLNVIQEAARTGQLPNELNGLVLTFKNPIDNQGYKIAFCTQAKYNELEAGGNLEADTLYIITDDETYDDLVELVDQIGDEVTSLNYDMNDAQTRLARLENAPYIFYATEDSDTKTIDSIYIGTIHEGMEILVRFTYWGASITWHSMTLNVNNTGAKTITANGTTITPNDSAVWAGGDLVKLRYEKQGNDYVWNVVENITQHVFYGQIRDY